MSDDDPIYGEQGDGYLGFARCYHKEGVHVGDRFRFSIQAFDFIRREPDQSTVVVVCAEIKVKDDGTKTIICNPE